MPILTHVVCKINRNLHTWQNRKIAARSRGKSPHMNQVIVSWWDVGIPIVPTTIFILMQNKVLHAARIYKGISSVMLCWPLANLTSKSAIMLIIHLSYFHFSCILSFAFHPNCPYRPVYNLSLLLSRFQLIRKNMSPSLV